MLPKQNRLKTRFEFNTTKKYGIYFGGYYFHSYMLKPSNYQGATRVGIVVSNKFHKRATKRNRIKRLFREAIKRQFDKMEKLNSNLWIVIYPKGSALEATYEKICTDFDKNIQKISIPD